VRLTLDREPPYRPTVAIAKSASQMFGLSFPRRAQ
jgi:hypothetical protein